MENRIKLSDDVLENVSGGAQQENNGAQSGNQNIKRMYCEECGEFRDFLLVGGGVAICLENRQHRKNV